MPASECIALERLMPRRATSSIRGSLRRGQHRKPHARVSASSPARRQKPKIVPGKVDPEPQRPFLDAYAQLKQKNRKSGFAGSIRLVHHCGISGPVPGYADFSRHPGEGGLQSGAGTQSNGLGISATLH